MAMGVDETRHGGGAIAIYLRRGRRGRLSVAQRRDVALIDLDPAMFDVTAEAIDHTYVYKLPLPQRSLGTAQEQRDEDARRRPARSRRHREDLQEEKQPDHAQHGKCRDYPERAFQVNVVARCSVALNHCDPVVFRPVACAIAVPRERAKVEAARFGVNGSLVTNCYNRVCVLQLDAGKRTIGEGGGQCGCRNWKKVR